MTTTDYPHRVRSYAADLVHAARITEQPVYDRTLFTPCLGYLRPGSVEQVADDTPVTCTLCVACLKEPNR